MSNLETNEKISNAIIDLVKQKDDFIIEKLKELFKSADIWIESHGMKFVGDLNGLLVKEDVRFNFSGLDKINELKDTNERLKCCGNCHYDAFDGDYSCCGYFEETGNTTVCKRRMDARGTENPDLWTEGIGRGSL